jgi:hypothetical protein
MIIYFDVTLSVAKGLGVGGMRFFGPSGLQNDMGWLDC